MALASERASVPSRGGMQKARRYRLLGLTLTASLAGFIALSACSNYSEGDRCEQDDDCQDGLTCLKASEVNPLYNSSARCCPPDRATASHPACTVLQNVLDSSTPPAETGPTPDATVDAAETSTPAEAGSDADAADDAADGD
jgi:hypothetical protein